MELNEQQISNLYNQCKEATNTICIKYANSIRKRLISVEDINSLANEVIVSIMADYETTKNPVGLFIYRMNNKIIDFNRTINMAKRIPVDAINALDDLCVNTDDDDLSIEIADTRENNYDIIIEKSFVDEIINKISDELIAQAFTLISQGYDEKEVIIMLGVTKRVYDKRKAVVIESLRKMYPDY